MDEWIRLMNARTEEELEMMIASKNIGVRMAAMKMKKLNLIQNIRWLYEAHMKEKRDRKWIEDGIREEARAAGLEEGRAEGLADGELRGNINAYQEMGVSKSETIEKIAERFQLSKNEATQSVEKYWE